MLKTWLTPGAPARSYIMLELKDGGDYNWAPKFKFEVWGNEPGSSGFGTKDANLINMAFPPEWGSDRADVMLEFVKELCEIFPYQSGHAGFCFQVSQYWRKEGQNSAWATSMRHRGIDIFGHPNDKMAARHDGIKGINWLTILCQPFVDRLGGTEKLRRSLPQSVEILAVKGGLLLKAGSRPQTGDTNRREFLPEYKAVYKVVAPLAEIGYSRSPALLAGNMANYEENTLAWRRRFADV